MTIQTTLLFLVQDDQILLAFKKRGHGQGNMNGVGGKLDSGEKPLAAAIRECEEEIGVTPIAPTKVALLTFHEQEEGGDTIQCHVFVANEWEGEPVETEEMAPEWYFMDMIPYDQMWEDDQYWLPHVLDGQCVIGDFYFDEEQKMVSHELALVKPEELS